MTTGTSASSASDRDRRRRRRRRDSGVVVVVVLLVSIAIAIFSVVREAVAFRPPSPPRSGGGGRPLGRIAATTLNGKDIETTTIGRRRRRRRSVVVVYGYDGNNGGGNGGGFDVSRPVFDPLSLRSVRGDALVRYDATNQSEPLRILLWGSSSIAFAIAPSLVVATGYDPLNGIATVGCAIAAIATGFGFRRECGYRERQLSRIEKELATESLPIRLPSKASAYSASVNPTFGRASTLKGLKSTEKPPRILAVCGTSEKLSEALADLAVYRNRLEAASAYVVAVSTDGSKPSEWKLSSGGDSNGDNNRYYASWLADPYQPEVWRDYFRSLKEDDEKDGNGEDDFRWFGLNSNGRSFGSGDGPIQVIQLMGRFLRPADFLDVDDGTSVADAASTTTDDDEREILETLATFYRGLTEGDEEALASVFAAVDDENADEVTEVLEQGGRVDPWKACLAEGARPEGMVVTDADVTLTSPDVAHTTCLELTVDGGSLLAVQRFKLLAREEDDDKGGWKLDLHQTIPWNPEAPAMGTLRCDRRGCAALTRGEDRRTFGGLIG